MSERARQRVSAGLLMFRRRAGQLEVLLAHPGGPYFQNKDEGAWSIPKGEVEAGDELLDTARREFTEEVGAEPGGAFIPLGEIQQKGGKRVHAWAFEGDHPGGPVPSNTFTVEWPPRSGKLQEFPEVDRVELFDLDRARRKLNPAQVPFLDRLVEALGTRVTC